MASTVGIVMPEKLLQGGDRETGIGNRLAIRT